MCSAGRGTWAGPAGPVPAECGAGASAGFGGAAACDLPLCLLVPILKGIYVRLAQSVCVSITGKKSVPGSITGCQHLREYATLRGF